MLLNANVYLSKDNTLIVHIRDVSKPYFPGHYFPLEFQILQGHAERILDAYKLHDVGEITVALGSLEPPEVHPE